MNPKQAGIDTGLRQWVVLDYTDVTEGMRSEAAALSSPGAPASSDSTQVKHRHRIAAMSGTALACW